MSQEKVCPLVELTVEKLEPDIHQALQGWDKQKPAVNSIGYLRLFHELARQNGYDVRGVNKRIFEQGVNDLKWRSVQDEKKAKLLEEKYRGGMKNEQLANSYHIQDKGFFKRSQKARRRLAEVIYQLEHNARSKHRDKQFQRLEKPTYDLLVGANTIQESLKDHLRKEGSSFIIAVEGLGGIGKSAQVDYLFREEIHEDRWDEFVWISAKQEKLTDSGRLLELGQPELTNEVLIERLFSVLFPDSHKSKTSSYETALIKLEDRLKQYPCCICIDNIETATDINAILPTLERLVNPSKIILTTREEIQEHILSITHVEMAELSADDTLLLIRETALAKHLTHVQEMSDRDLGLVFQTVGGHPLAICLLIGQIDRYGLHQVLEDIREACGEANENLFDYIYSTAWEGLNPSTRSVLLAILLLHPQGGEYALLAHIIQMSRGELLKALDELIGLSLVQTRGHGTETLFSLHSLTRTFLHQEIQKGCESSDEDNISTNFDEYIVQAINFVYSEVKKYGSFSNANEQAQALHILVYGLDLASRNSSAWSFTRDLLIGLIPKLELSGFHAGWIQYVKQGIEISKANFYNQDEAILQAHLGYLHLIAGHYETAHDILALSATYFEQANDTDNLARVIAQRAYMYALQRQHEEADPLIQRVLELLSVTDPQREYVYYIQGLIALSDNDGIGAEHWVRKSLQCCEELGNKRLTAKRLSNLGTALYMQSQPEQSLAYYERAIALFDELQDHVQGAIAQIGVGINALVQKQPHKALIAFEKAKPSLRKEHDVLHLAILDVNSGLAKHQLKEWDEAEEFLLRAISRYQQLKDFYREANARYEYGLLLADQNLVEDAHEAFNLALGCLSKGQPSSGRNRLQQKISDSIDQLAL